MKKPAFSLVIIILFVSFFLASCKIESYNEKKPIIIKGSDTMVNLTQKWAEVYMNKNPNVSIQVTGGGSGNGIVSLFNGTATIANISRELKDKEIQKAIEYNVSPYKIKAALDGIAIIIHPSNKIDSLTIENIRDIYTGRITNWQELGGSNSKIILYGRENSSGTYEYFKETVLGKDEQGKPFDFISRTQVLQGTASLAEAVSKDKNGIGYGGVGYFALRNDLKILAVKKSKEEKAISPIKNKSINYDVIWSGEYSLSRFLYCYTNGKPEGELKNYIDFISSESGQNIVKQMEYIPLPKKDRKQE